MKQKLILFIALFILSIPSYSQISDPLEYPVGGVTYGSVAPAITQLKTFPPPRYKKNHTLLPHFNVIDPIYFGGYKQPGVLDATAIHDQADLQRELIKNWNYMITLNWFGNAYTDTCVAIANANPSIKACIMTLRQQTTGGTKLYNQGFANDHYFQNSSGTFLDWSGNPALPGNKVWRPTAPPADYSSDGTGILNILTPSLAGLTRNVDMVNEDGEVYPVIESSALANDPACVADRIALNIPWNGGFAFPYFPYLARRVADNDKAYSAKFMIHPRLVNAKYTEYRFDGQVQYQFCWQEIRKAESQINGQYYSTGDLYVRWPYNWQNWSSAWHGLKWFSQGRFYELKLGDRLFSPFMAAGWDNDATKNVLPAQWLGLNKIMNMWGAEFFYPAFFNEGPYDNVSLFPANPKGYAWQAATPSYAQAVMSQWENILRGGNLMIGDTTDVSNPIENSPLYRFKTGAINKLVIVRKDTVTNGKFVILGVIMNSENISGVTPLTSTATFTMEGESFTIPIARHGYTFIYDKTNPLDKKFYQLDAWHEYKHPERWSQDIIWDTEVMSSKSSGVTIKTEGISGTNYTAANSYIKFSAAGDTVSYPVQRSETSATTRYFWIKARTVGSVSTGVKIRIGSTTRNISCIVGNSWAWYRVDSALNVPISFNLTTAQVDLILTAKNSSVEIDKFYMTESSADLYGATPTSCNSVVCTITPSGPLTFCTGGSVVLSANASDSYLWSTGANTQNITVTTAGTYSVTVTQSGQSAPCAPVTVTVTSLPTASITSSGTSICPGSSKLLTAATAAGNTYQWRVGGSNIPFATANTYSATAAGTYTCVVTNTGCSATSNSIVITITSNPTAVITAGGPTTFCAGGSVILTVTAATTYLWSTGATTQGITVTTSGTYTATVTDGSGCTAVSAGKTVTVNSLPVASISAGGSTSFCAGGSVLLTATPGTGYTYQWKNNGTNISGQTNNTYTATTTANYTVIVTSGGCTNTSNSISVTVTPTTTTANAGTDQSICGTTATLGGNTPVNGTGTWTLISGTATITTPSSPNSGVTAIATGANVFRWTITNSPCASSTDNVTITKSASNAVSGTISANNNPFCNGESVTFTAVAVNIGTGTYQWKLNGGNVGTNSATYTLVVPVAADQVVCEFTSDLGCATGNPATSNTITLTASTITASIAPAGTTAICAGGSQLLTATSVGAVAYQWRNAGVNILAATNSTYSATAAGTYTVVTTNVDGCTAVSNTATITVNVLPTAVITPSGPTTFCSGGSVDLSASTNTSYVWSTGATTQVITVSSAATYTVTVTNGFGCTATDSQVIVVGSTPTATLTPSNDVTVCSGTSRLLSMNTGGGLTYQWYNGGVVISGQVNSTYTATTTGDYYAIVTNAGACTKSSDTASITFSVMAIPTITAGGSLSFCAGGSVVLTSSSATNYLWSNSATTQSITVSVSGNYSVKTANGFGCTATSVVTAVTVFPLPTTATTTPNGTIYICGTASIALTANTSTGYLWSTGETTKTITAHNAGLYTVTITNANGCTKSSAAVLLSDTCVSNICGVPFGLYMGRVTATTARVKWSGPAATNGWTLYLQDMSTGRILEPAPFYKDKNRREIYITGLKSRNTYKWWLTARCGTTDTPVSPAKVFTTL